MKDSLIFDRTEADIEQARSIINEKIKKFLATTKEEESIVERGAFLPSTVQRIEDSEKELFVLLKDLAYYGEEPSTKEWVLGDIFSEEDMSRIIENGELLRESFFTYSATPTKASPKYDYKNLNKIEKLLYDLFSIVEYIEENAKECDTFYSGEE